MKFPKKYRWIWVPSLVLVTFCLAYLGVLQCFGNFHEVIKGELYRSAQLEPAHLNTEIQQYGIRTVLNLRGANVGTVWYDDEVRATQAAGIKHVDFRMSSARELSFDEAKTLIALMRDAPKPLLIHCRAGADRTGLASALYLAAIAKQGEWAAEMQLWPIYGHLPLQFNDAMAMNRTFEALERFLGYYNS